MVQSTIGQVLTNIEREIQAEFHNSAPAAAAQFHRFRDADDGRARDGDA